MRRFQNFVTPLMIASAISYMAWATLQNRESVVDALNQSNPIAFVYSTLMFIVMFISQSTYHALTLRGMDRNNTSSYFRKDSAAYMQSQIVRYLPGKIWGLVYQVGRTKDRHPTTRILAANLWQMATTNALSLGIGAALVLLATVIVPPWAAIALALLSITTIEFFHRTNLLSAMARPLIARLPWLERFDLPERPGGLRSKGTSLLLLEWICFAFGLWLLMGDQMAWTAKIAAIGWYAVSSIVAILAIAVPAGLVVREALFVGTHDLIDAPAAILIVVATQARLSMIAGELLACGIITLAARSKRDAT